MENKIVEVIIKPGHSIFKTTDKLQNLMKKKGHKYLFTMEARTDKDLIEYIKRNSTPEPYRIMLGRKSEYGQGYVTVVEVDTSRPWYIREYDNAESICYVDYDVVDEKLNMVKMRGN